MTERKYNRVLWCDRTPNGYWSVALETPGGTIFHRVYIGYSKAEALRRARHERPQGAAIVNRGAPRRRSRS